MSKVERLRDENFNIQQLIEKKEKEYKFQNQKESSNWGKRGTVLSIGKPMKEMLFHYGKNIASARKQIELMHDWFLQCEDRRTRVVGKAWFEKQAGVFDQLRENEFFAEFFSPEDESDTEFLYRQRFYTYEKALKIMKKITENKESQYILTNPVYALPHELKNNYGKRTIDRLTELHVVYAELDHYKIKKYEKKNAKEMWKIVRKHLIEAGFPLPTEVIFSRGLHLYWKTAPIPAFMLDEWRLLMAHVNQLLSEFGADPNALDPVRILRAVGSIHEVTGEKITGQTFSKDRYDFMELFNTYCYEEWKLHLLQQAKERQKRVQALEKRWIEKQEWMFENEIIDENGDFTEKYEPKKKQKRKKIISSEAKEHYYNSRHKNIIDGVFWLSDVVRKGNMEGCREFSCYLVRTMAMRVTGGNTIESLRIMEELYSGFSPQKYSWNDLVERTSSAEIDYKRWLQNETLGVRYKTSTLIEKLKITPSEMSQMRFIVDKERSKELKLERDRLFQKEKRKEKGMISHGEKRRAVLKYFEKNPEATQVQAEKDLGITRKTIRKYLSEN